jgi:hypothetical protein
MGKSAIATTRKKPVTAAERRLRELDPDLAQLLDDMDKRLRAEQDVEQAAHQPIDWDTVQADLDAERARLFLAGGAMIDQIMAIGELSVHVARQAAGMEAAEMMAQAGLKMPQHPRALLPPPDADGDGSVPRATPILPGQSQETAGMGAPTDDDDSDDDDTDQLRVIHEDAKEAAEAETVETQKVWVPSWRTDSVTHEADAVPGQGKGSRIIKWTARQIATVAYTVSATITGLALIGATLTEWAIS